MQKNSQMGKILKIKKFCGENNEGKHALLCETAWMATARSSHFKKLLQINLLQNISQSKMVKLDNNKIGKILFIIGLCNVYAIFKRFSFAEVCWFSKQDYALYTGF